jgi:tRNA A-37 threonylcarbamoyl transferase component Bud32
MSSRLASVASEVAAVFPGLEEIVRVDIDDSGTLTLTAAGATGTRWFTHDDRGLIECFPERDKNLPLAGRLRDTADWSVLSYRPGRRMVVRIRHGAHQNIFKGHKKGRAARAAVHQGYAEGSMRTGAFRVPRMLGLDPNLEALVFECLEVQEVELVRASAPHYERLGRQLARFQDDQNSVSLQFFRVQDELDVLRRWKEKVLAAIGTLPAGWLEGEARLLRQAEHLPAARIGLCHRDLHDRQVHLERGEVVLLDFDLLCCADVALDPGNMLAHLRWRAIQGLHGADAASARELEAAFLAGLGERDHGPFRTRLAFYTASALLRLALVYRLRPRWSERVTELVETAALALDDLAPVR